MNKKISLLILLLVLFGSLYAQIGVNTESPNALTELDVRNIVNGTDTIPKGIVIPRLRTVQRDQIDVSDTKLGNGVMIYNIDEDCYNYYNKIEGEWKSICGKIGKAIFTIDCNNLKVAGEYKNGQELGGANYLSISVTVTKPGTYSITATVTDPLNENGYYFTASGEFLSTGTYTVRVPGMGTPANYTTPNFDNFTVALNGVRANGTENACTFDVEVKNSAIKPRYTMDCSGTKVYGEYYEDVALTTANYIEVVLNVEPSSYGATYELETSLVDGIMFKGSGVLNTSTQVVRLYGEGTPYSTDDKRLYIKANSISSSATCMATVYIIIPQKRVMTIGTSSAYGYNLGRVGAASNTMITDPNNFGPYSYSIVRYSGFTNAGTAYDSNRKTSGNNGGNIIAFWETDLNSASSDAMFSNYLKGINGYTKVDVVTIGYNWNGINDNKAQALVDFLNEGGILLMFCEETASNRTFLRKLFNKPDIDITSGGPPGSIYRYASITDPILNGPFGNLTSLTWGEDASTTLFATNLPLEEVTLYSSNQNISGAGSSSTLVENSATAFRHNTLPFVWVGDGGFNSNNTSTSASTICPFKMTTKTINGHVYTNFPYYRAKFGPTAATQTWNAYNAIFTANAMAWCIKRAEELKRAQKNQETQP